MIKRLFIIILLVINSGLASAKEDTIEQNSLIEKVLDLSGARRQIGDLSAIIISEFTKSKGDMSPEVYAKMVKILEQSFQGQVLYQGVVENFRSNFDEGHLTAILQWLESPLSRKITQLEISASTVEAMQQIKNFAVTLQTNPPSQKRLELVHRLDEATAVSYLTNDVYLVNYKAMIKSFNSILPLEQRITEEKLEETISGLKTSLHPTIKNSVLLNFLYTYDSLMDEEIEKYIEFYESENGKWFVKASNESLLNVVAKASENVGRQMSQLLTDEKNKAEQLFEKEGISREDFYNVNTFYYQNPQPDKLIPVLKVLFAQEGFLMDNSRSDAFFHFVATIAYRDQTVLKNLRKIKNEYSGEQKVALSRIIEEAENFHLSQPDSVKHLDYLWAEFLASGEEEPVKKIISVLNFPETGENLFMIGAVEWSLASNAKMHKKVYEIIQMQYIDSKDKLRERLGNILQKIEVAK